MDLKSLAGVADHKFVQCPFGAYSVKPTLLRYYLATISSDAFPSSCPHPVRRWKYEDGEVITANHPPLIGTRRAVLEEAWIPNQQVSSEYISKSAAHYTSSLNLALLDAITSPRSPASPFITAPPLMSNVGPQRVRQPDATRPSIQPRSSLVAAELAYGGMRAPHKVVQPTSDISVRLRRLTEDYLVKRPHAVRLLISSIRGSEGLF